MEQEKKSVTLSVLLHQAAAKDGSCFRIRYPIMHSEKVIDFFGGNTLCENKKGVLRPSLFCFMHKLPTQNLYILSVSAFISCAWM